MESDAKAESALANQTGPAERPCRKAVRRFVFAYLAVSFIAGVVFWLLSCREPRYQGVSLSTWLKKYDDAFDADPQSAEAADAVRQIGSNAIPQLLRWASASDSKLKEKLEEWATKQSLIKFDFTDADDYHERAVLGFRLIGSQGKSAFSGLQKLLGKTNTVETAAEILCQFGPDAAPVLLNGLTNNDAEIRGVIASEIWRWNNQPDNSSLEITLPIPTLLSLLQDSESNVRILALQGIGKAAASNLVKPETAVPLLIQQLRGSDRACTEEAANALIPFGPAARVAIPHLLEILSNSTVPCVIQGPIGYRGTNGVFSAAISTLVTEPTVIVQTGRGNPPIGSVNFVGPDWVIASASMANNGYIIHSLQALHAEPSQVIAILEKKLQSGNALTQYWASAALASYGSEAESSVPALLRSATGPDPILRAAVFRALEQIGPEISRTNLSLLDIDYRDSTLISSEITSLQSWGPFDRRIAAYRLGKFGAAAESAMPALLKATKDEDEKVCAAAREALKSINPEAARKAGVE